MIPPTKNGLPAMACLSAMQKCIRRNMEQEAMEFAVELMSTSKAFVTMVTNRLEIISHEDIDTEAQPYIVPFVSCACDLARRLHDPKKPGKSRIPVGNAIRMMCHAAKSREGDHFAIAFGFRADLEGFVPDIPDWANDMHTLAGRKQGRGIEHFKTESVKLVPKPGCKDKYEDEAFRLLSVRHPAKP